MSVPTDQEFEDIEQKLVDIAKEAQQIEKDVRDLINTTKKSNREETGNSRDRMQQTKVIGEKVTQALVKCDSIPVSRSIAATALRDGNRQAARKMAVLITRRKNLISKLEASGTKIEEFQKSFASQKGL